MKTFKQHLREGKEIWYHGRTVKDTKFDVKYTGKGNDQEGPGFYFTTLKEEAARYTDHGGIIISVELNPRKLVSGKPNKAELTKLIKMAPDYKMTLTDWGEDPYDAFETVINGMMDNDTKYDAFQSVWYDFYRYEPADYLRNVVKLGYDGHKGVTLKYAIVIYNPKAIKVIDHEDI